MTRRTHFSLVMLGAVTSFALGYTAPAARAAEVIQPGSSITMGGSYCTLNWIYDGTGAQAGNVFGGTARHCVSGVGQVVYNASTSLGTQGTRIGTVAYVSAALDSALIQIDTARLGDVVAALRGHPNIPTGVSQNSAVGDLIQFSGHGVGFHLTEPTQTSRVGVLAYDDGTQHYVDGPVSNGDSGGPVADITDGNTALGIVNTLGVAVDTGTFIATAGEGGVSLKALFLDAAANGFPIALRTI